MLSKIIRMKDEKGFTLIELMIVVAIIGILAAIAVPNFIAYRNKSRVASCIATCESIRGCQAGYAADHDENYFPNDTTITSADWDTLTTTLNPHGCTLRDTAGAQGFQSAFTYDSFDSDADATDDDYYFIFRVQGVPGSQTGSQIEVRTSGIMKWTY